MQDKTIKLLLAIIAVFLFALLVRRPIAEARAQAPATQSSSTMVVNGETVYVLQDNKLSVYEFDVEPDVKLTPYQVGLMSKAQARLVRTKSAHLYRVISKDLSAAEVQKEIPMPANPPAPGK